MNILKTIVLILLPLLALLWVANPEIRLSPLNIKLHTPWRAVGLLLLFGAIICMQIDSYRQGSLQGYKDALNDVLQSVQSKKS